ncbi:MAG TPA: DUF3168 domain-containing protein [Dehalococcoidales bacterium]|nr:DUF3168 domain-containing protein [Dehalococcoidales bacterium]
MLIEQALMTYLLAQSGITDLVSTRIHFVKAHQDIDAPYLVLFKVSGPREHSHDGSSELAHPRFQFSAFATKYSDAKAVIAAVQAALQGYSGIMGGAGGVYVNGCFYEDENDFYETDTNLHHVSADYIFWHEE